VIEILEKFPNTRGCFVSEKINTKAELLLELEKALCHQCYCRGTSGKGLTLAECRLTNRAVRQPDECDDVFSFSMSCIYDPSVGILSHWYLKGVEAWHQLNALFL
jgi:hypothetical protein